MEHRDPQDSFEAADTGAFPPSTGTPAGEPSVTARDVTGTVGTTPSQEGRLEHGAESAKQRMNQVAGQARQKASQAAGQAKEKASQLKVTLADKLDAGAGKLRQKTAQATSEMESPTTAEGAATQATQKMDRMSSAVASGMEGTANWLRTTDLESIRADIEQQVRTKPGRSLLVALGVGYVLARVFRSSSEH